MARVMIVCPESELPIYTHVSCTAAEFTDLPADQTPVKCPECEKTHSWTPGDAFLEEDGGGD